MFGGTFFTTNIGVNFIIGLRNSGNISIGNNVPNISNNLSYTQWNGAGSSIQNAIILIAILKVEFISTPKQYCY